METMKAGDGFGLRVDMEKTKYVIMKRKIGTLSDITTGNNRIEHIRDFKYLEMILDKQNFMH